MSGREDGEPERKRERESIKSPQIFSFTNADYEMFAVNMFNLNKHICWVLLTRSRSKLTSCFKFLNI